jgi:hypothetical protein
MALGVRILPFVAFLRRIMFKRLSRKTKRPTTSS